MNVSYSRFAPAYFFCATRFVARLFATLSIALLAACATTSDAPSDATSTTPPAATNQPAAVPPPKRAGELALAEGVDIYNQGNYASAIKKLQESAEIWIESNPIKIEAHKHIAFASCSIPARIALCRQSFERILDIDPNFELSAAEKDHPVWGLVFRQAKQARSTRRPTR
jgi:hypothetical protein